MNRAEPSAPQLHGVLHISERGDVGAQDQHFSAASFGPPVDANGNFTSSAYNPGSACQVVLVRNVYKWTLHTPFFTTFLVNNGTNKRLLSAATAFRNEPF